METLTLKAEVRVERGKGPARQLRMRGLIPAVFYGPRREPQNLTLSPADLAKVVTGAYGKNQVVELEVAGKKELALVRDIEVDRLTREVLHADFYCVSRDRPVRAHVPFEAHGRAVGVQKGGVLKKIYRDLPVIAAPDKIPAKIEVDVAALDMNESIRVKDITLADGARIDFPAERALVAVVAKEKEKPEEGEAVPGAPAAAAAPAAGGKAAPAAKDAKAAPAKDAKKK